MKAPEPDVKVHLAKGCPLCGRTDQHTHSQRDWRRLLDNMPSPWDRL